MAFVGWERPLIMLRTLVLAIALAGTLAGCGPSVEKAYAQCKSEALKDDPEDDSPNIDRCMNKRGFEIADGDCSISMDGATPERCFRRKIGAQP